MERIAGLSAGLKSLLSISKKQSKGDKGDDGPSPSGDYRHGSGSNPDSPNQNRGSPDGGLARVDSLVKEQLNALSEGLSAKEIDDLMDQLHKKRRSLI